MNRVRYGITAAVCAALLAAPAASAAAPTICATEPLMKNVRSLERFLVERKGVNLLGADSTSSLWFKEDKTANPSLAMARKCDQPARLTFAGNSAAGTCAMVGGMEGESQGEEMSFELTVTAASPRYMIARMTMGFRTDEGIYFYDAANTQWEVLWKAGGPISAVDLIEVIPGAKSRELFEAVKERLLRPESGGACRNVFEGPQAKDVRTVSEIFYSTTAAKANAEMTAALLADIIGKVVVKPWPGSWQYGVVVVVGDKVGGTK